MTKTTKQDYKDIVKLQEAIIDGLEDVKAHDIRVFDTTALTPLFERVMIASGNSNRQTRALAMSIRDKVREAGFPKPRIGGEDNGEWITVDCGAAVAHIMQPEIRRYYNLEEIWGEVPVHGLTAAEKKAVKAEKAASKKVSAKNADEGSVSEEAAAAPKPAAKKAPAKTAAKTAAKSATKPAAKKAPAKVAAAGAEGTAAVKKPAAKKTAVKTATAKPVTKLVVGEPVKKAAAKKASAKTAAAKPAAKKAAAKKPAAKKAV